MDFKSKFIVSFLIAFLVTILLFLFLNNSNQNKMELLTIPLNEWKNIYDNNGNSIVIDVRTPEEFNEGHIKNAININFYDTNFKNQLNNLDKDKKYLIYCRSGARSSKTLDIMRNLEFNEVYDLERGIIVWNNANYNLIN
jgi:rhodanese-related sulfurtransferase